MAFQVKASELGAHVGRRARFVINGELQLSVHEIRAASIQHGRVRVTLAYCGYVFSRLDPQPGWVEFHPLERPVWILEATHDSGDARDVTGCFCPGDCGCKPHNSRPNCCGCAGMH